MPEFTVTFTEKRIYKCTVKVEAENDVDAHLAVMAGEYDEDKVEVVGWIRDEEL